MKHIDFSDTQPLPLVLALAAQQVPDEPRPWWRWWALAIVFLALAVGLPMMMGR